MHKAPHIDSAINLMLRVAAIQDSPPSEVLERVVVAILNADQEVSKDLQHWAHRHSEECGALEEELDERS